MSVLFVLTACFSVRRMEAVKRDGIAPTLSAADYLKPEMIRPDSLIRDTMKVQGSDGKELLIMRAVRDEDGQMVATEQLGASIVVTTFRNVAERNGKVELRFRIGVPSVLQESSWQLRIRPVLYVFDEAEPLEPIYISGKEYRQSQIRGQQAFERYCKSIVTDSLAFLRERELLSFWQRNSGGKVRFSEAEDHYTLHLLKSLNHRRKERSPIVYGRLVKSPLDVPGLRLDTVLFRPDGVFEYEYVQMIPTRPKLRKVEIGLETVVSDTGGQCIRLDDDFKISFYISSLSTLIQDKVRYVEKIVERRVFDQSICWLEFRQGSAFLDPRLGNNSSEIERIRAAVVQLSENDDMVLDSVVVTASSSPEGTYSFNRRLSESRSRSVCAYFDELLRSSEISGEFRTGTEPENWDRLFTIISSDDSLSTVQKEEILSVRSVKDPDLREKRLSRLESYRYLRENIYPLLRTVSFNFHLHRKGMVKDTIRTALVDTVYASGLEAMRNRDFASAMKLLATYRDYNTAVACVATNRNATALDILMALEPTPEVNYLLAIVYSRQGLDSQAVRCYLDACREKPSLSHRGNLDPEISLLTHKYVIK